MPLRVFAGSYRSQKPIAVLDYPASPIASGPFPDRSNIQTGYTKVVKLTFARGASIPDPSRLFNSSLEGNMRRAIDIHEGEKVDARAFKALVKAAVARNGPPATR